MEAAVRYKSMSLIARQKISIVLDRVRAASRGRADVGLRLKNEATLRAYSVQEPQRFQFLGGGTITTEQRTIEFHTIMGHPVRTTPQTLTREEAILALALIEEEYLELVDALFPDVRDDISWSCEQWTPVEKLKFEQEHLNPYDRTRYAPDLVAIADAVADLDVVVNGCGIRHGLPMQALSREVFASNMSKLGADGKPVYTVPGDPTSKIAKGPDFREPDIAGVLGLGVSA